MKKVLALLMTFAMLLGCMMSVGAMGVTESYPMLYETFETDAALDVIRRGGGGKGTVTIADGGVNGSAGSLHVVQTSAGNYIDSQYTANGLQFAKGQTVNISLWAKMNSVLNTETSNSNQISLIFYGHGTVSAVGTREDIAVGDTWNKSVGWKEFYISNKLVTGEWVHLTQSVTWPDEMSIGSGATINNISLQSFAIRVANQNGTNAVVDNANLDYQIDDLILSTPGVDESSIVAANDFDNESATGALDGRSEDCSLPYFKKTYTADQVDTTKGYIVDQQPNVAISANLRPGHMYKISGWYRYDADEAATDFEVSKLQLRMIFMSKDRNDANFCPGNNYPSYYSKTYPVGEWTKLEYYFYMDYQMYTLNPGGYLWMRPCPYYTYQGGNETQVRDHIVPGTYSADNIVVEDLGSPANGNMELDPSVTLVRNFSETTQAVPGWNATGSDAEAVTENDNTYLKYTTTGANFGTVKTAYDFENGKTYRITFKAKAESYEDGKSVPLTLIMDRKVDTVGSGDAYTVPNYEYLQGNDTVNASPYAADQPWQLTNQWQTFTCKYTTSFAAKEGMEEAAASVNPRSPIIYPYAYESASSVSPQGTVICLDDFSIVEESEALDSGIYAEAKNVTVSGNAAVGEALTVSYSYVPYGTETENKDATLVRAYIINNGAEANIGTFAASESFTVPVVAYGKDIYFEVIPVSATGGIGKSAVSAPVSVAATNILTYSSDKGVVAYSPEGSAKVLFATYTGKEMVDVKIVDAAFTDYKFTCNVPEDLEAGDSMKVMLWKDLTSFAPLTAPVSE